MMLRPVLEGFSLIYRTYKKFRVEKKKGLRNIFTLIERICGNVPIYINRE